MDDQEVQWAQTAGVLVRRPDTNGYDCVVCNRTMTDIAPHLRGKDHKNNLTRETLRNPAPNKLLLDTLPPLVRDAKLKNEIELVDKMSSPYRCLVCPKKPVFSGIMILEDHLKSKDHEEVKKTMSLYYSPSLTLMPHVSRTQANFVPENQNPLANKPQYMQHQPYLHKSCLQPSTIPVSQHYQSQYPKVSSPQPLQVSEARYLPNPPQLPSQPLYNPMTLVQYPPSTRSPASTMAPAHTGYLQQTNSLTVGATGVLPFPSDGGPSSTRLDPELQRALDKGEVVRDAENFFTCQICNKKVNGPSPLVEHLKSDKHKKKAQTQLVPDTGRMTLVDRAYESLAIGIGRGDQAVGATGVLSFPSEGGPSSTRLDPEVQRALDKGEVVRDSENSFACRVCSKTVSGPAPLLEHLKSDKHKKKVQTQLIPDIGRLTLIDSPCGSLPLGMEKDKATSLWANRPLVACTSYAVGATGVLSFPSDDGLSSTRLDPELQRALDKGEVVRDAENSFTCQMCNKNVNGPSPLVEHLKSDKHKKKAQTQLVPDTGRLTLVDRAYESLPIGIGRGDQVDGFPWQVRPSIQLHPPSENVYCNLSRPRGLVLVFNYYFRGGNERHGAKRDSFNLKTLFTSMGYQVYLYEDRSKRDTELILQEIQESQFLKIYDSFIVFILSHGKNDLIFYAGGVGDEDCMSLDDVRYIFTDTVCPALKGKPKLFFVNFCRGTQKESQILFDNLSSSQVAPKDMVTVYSCINKFQAPREPAKGTVFVQVLCEVLSAHAHDTELQDLHLFVCYLMKERNGATPEIQGYDFKKFYFNPVNP